MRSHEESRIQRNCVEWFFKQYPDGLLFAIENGGKRSKTEGAILKGMGIMPGVSDLCLAHKKTGKKFDDPDYGALYIEIKTPTGRQSKSQIAFEKNVLANGYDYKLCRSLDEFIKIVNEYLK